MANGSKFGSRSGSMAEFCRAKMSAIFATGFAF